MRLLAEEGLYHFLDFRHARHAANQHHFVDLTGGEPGILEGCLARRDRLLHQIVDQRFKFRARELQRHMFWPRGVRRDVGQVDLGLGGGGKLDLRLFRRLLETLQGQLVLLQVDALLLLELVGEIFDQTHVEILATKEGVAISGFDLEHPIADFQNRHVERATAEIVNGDDAGLFLVKAVGERRRRRLIDDAHHLKAGDLAGILGCLTLGIVEIGRHRDHGLRHRLAQMGFRRLLHLHQRIG